MGNLFKKFYGMISDAQKKLLMGKVNVSTQQLNDYVYDGGNSPITTFTMVDKDAKLSEARYNEVMSSLLIDIAALYVNTDLVSNIIGGNESISKLWVNTINSEIDKLTRKIEEYKRLYSDDKGYNAIYYESFDENYKAILNNTVIDSGVLTVKPYSIDEYTKPIDIDVMTLITYPAENHIAGIYLASPPEFDIVKDYRLKRGTKEIIKKGTKYPGAWVSVLMSDTDVKSYIDDIEYSGYNCLLRIFFNAPKNINSLSISPATRYKLGVSRLKYRKGGIYATDDDGWEFVTKTYYTNDIYNGDTIRVTGSGYSSINLQFDTIQAAAIEILFTMPSYDVIRYNIDKAIIRSAMMWDSITDEEYTDLLSKYSNKDVVSADTPTISNTMYLDRTIIDITNLNDLNSMVKAVNSSLNINPTTDLNSTSLPNVYLLNDKADEVALKGQLQTVNKNEYVIGAYSIVPEHKVYNNKGTYISHETYGFDSYDGTVARVALESSFETQALSSVEFFIVTDTDVEIPILPLGVTTHREPMDAVIDDVGTAIFYPSFTPTGNVTVYKWQNGVKVSTGSYPVTSDKITATGLNSMTFYAVEYETSQTNILLSDNITNPVWVDTQPTLNGNKAILPASPFIDYSYYDWDNDIWEAYEKLAGYYSDNSVLPQDVESPMWTFSDAWASSVFVPELTDRENFAISGYFLTSGEYYFVFNGKDDITDQIGAENYEYSYMWSIPVSGYASGDFPLASTVYFNDNNLEFDINSGNYNTNLYEPIEMFINGMKVIDKTNYKSTEQDVLSALTSQNYEFFLNGNTLYTNDNLDVSGKRVSVRYKYLSKYVRVKIILSTNDNSISENTPVVNDYTLKLFSI